MLRRVDDPESRKSLKPLDPPVPGETGFAFHGAGKPRDDDIKTFVAFYKGLFMVPTYKEEFIHALKSGEFC
jgi:hypothetical protein